MDVFGIEVDERSRCAHWRSEQDVVAIKFKCCGRFYACRQCHDECEDHEPILWGEEDAQESAVLCGVCEATMTVAQYLACDDACPRCATPFNPGCRAHRVSYFGF